MKKQLEELKLHPTAVIADAVFKKGGTVRGLPAGMRPLAANSRTAGPAVTVLCRNDLVAILEGLMRAEAGDVLLIDNGGFPGAGCIGDVVVSEAVRKGLAGIVVNGSIRDSVQISGMGLPVFHRGFFPVGPLKLPGSGNSHGQVNVTLDIDGLKIEPGDIVVGDADGVVVIEAAGLDKVIRKADEIERQEEALMEKIKGGRSLAVLFELEDYLKKRESDPEYPFNRHLSERKETI